MSSLNQPQFRGQRGAPPAALLNLLQPLMNTPHWDQPHQIITIAWDGARARITDETTIPLFVHPDKLPRAVMRCVQRVVDRQEATAAEQGTPPTLYAVAVLGEFWTVSHDHNAAGELDNARFNRDRRERRFHERDDRVETRACWIADIDQRTYSITMRRDTGRLSSHIYSDDTRVTVDPLLGKTLPAGQAIKLGGALAATLRACAATAGVILYGDAMPTGSDNTHLAAVHAFRPRAAQ